MKRSRSASRLLAPVLTLWTLSAHAAKPAPQDAIAAVLDDFHAAADQADGKRYFSHFAPDGIFLGTDASERWTVAQFKAYAEPHFAKGRGWKYLPRARQITLSRDSNSAWFDERLDSQEYGTCRGSGVLTRQGGAWKIAQYNLSVPIPNALLPGFAKTIRESAQSEERGFRDVTVAEAASLVQRRQGEARFVVLDVRTPGEFADGRVAGAVNLDFKASDFSERLALLDRGKTYLVHCAAGGRSGKSLEKMKSMGFRRVLHMKDGFNAWQKANYPTAH